MNYQRNTIRMQDIWQNERRQTREVLSRGRETGRQQEKAIKCEFRKIQVIDRPRSVEIVEEGKNMSIMIHVCRKQTHPSWTFEVDIYFAKYVYMYG